MRSAVGLFLAVPSFLTVIPVFAQLSVMDPQKVGSKPAYIDEATIVIEPRGGFVHESIYLEYSDHGQFPGNGNLEITHQFELPAGSAVNDLWLWVGDSVMRGTVLDTWTGRHIYDSIVTRKIDPAFLTKSGSRYDLKIYPLVSGKKRKVKLTLVAPTRWLGNVATAELPLVLLNGSAATKRPCRVLFKSASPIWGTPKIGELPFLLPRSNFDSLGNHYTFFQIADVAGLKSLSASFSVSFPNGVYAPPIERKGDSVYYQVGVDPGGWGVQVKSDSSMRSVAVGLDLSASALPGFATTLTRIRQSLHRNIRSTDRFRLFAASRDSVKTFGGWVRGDSVAIDSAYNALVASPFMSALSNARGPKVVFCDASASDLWSFPGIDSIAQVSRFTNIVDAAPSFAGADVVASYRHGKEDAELQNASIGMLLTKVDSLFSKGGRFLCFFDYNRTGYELIASHFISMLKTNLAYGSYPSATLYSRPEGRLYEQFLPTYATGAVNYLLYSDPTTRKELANGDGVPTVISKDVNKGLLVVSGLWTFSQSLETRKSLAIALLGIANQANHKGVAGLRPLLGTMQNAVKADSVDDVLVLSLGDSVYSAADAQTWAKSHVAAYGGAPPVFTTINLLDGSVFTPGVSTVDGVEYYGSGYQLKALASASRGTHFETHIRDWPYILSSLAYSAVPRLDSLLVVATAVGGPGSVREQFGVDQNTDNAAQPRFYAGVAGPATSVTFDVYAQFAYVPGTMHRTATSFGITDTLVQSVLPSMIGWYKLQQMFLTASADTARIVSWAMAYNLLCDYTCLLCFEPDAQHRPLVRPLDESKFVTHVWDTGTGVDSLLCGAYPNPFNGQTTIAVRLPHTGDITLAFYNMLGQRVREVNAKGVAGVYTCTWDATNDRGLPVASGVYIVQVRVRDVASGKQESRLLRVMLLR